MVRRSRFKEITSDRKSMALHLSQIGESTGRNADGVQRRRETMPRAILWSVMSSHTSLSILASCFNQMLPNTERNSLHNYPLPSVSKS
jgi:hypothetical protein